MLTDNIVKLQAFICKPDEPVLKSHKPKKGSEMQTTLRQQSLGMLELSKCLQDEEILQP